jgi:hypothetical protein
MHRVMLACLVAAACSPPPPSFPILCSGGAGGGPNATSPTDLEPIGLVGTSMGVTLTLATSSFCGDAGSGELQVVTEVLDPFNRAVEHTATPATATPAGRSTTVTFVPAQPGSYHLSAHFGPSLGFEQADLDVAADRTGAPNQSFRLPTQCEVLEQVPSGLRLCLESGRLSLFRDQLSVQSFEVDDFAVAGQAVWMIHGGLVSRWLDSSGQALTQAQLGTDAVGLGPGFTLLALENEAVVVSGMQATRVRVMGATLMTDASIGGECVDCSMSSDCGSGGICNAQHRCSRTCLSSGPGVTLAHPSPDLQGVLILNAGRFCKLKLTGGPAECSAAPEQPLGSDASGLWSSEGKRLVHRSFGATLDEPLKTVSLALNGIPQPAAKPSRHFQAAPTIQTGEARALAVRQVPATGIVFEQYTLPNGFDFAIGTSATLRAQHPDGRQLLITR